MSFDSFKQEMPPAGGYRPLNFERTRAKQFFNFKAAVLTSVAMPLIWLYLYKKEKRYLFVKELEYRNHSIPIEPCLTAERDRLFMKQLRINRDEERELMKNVPDWEVGKLFDEKIFRTVPEEKLVNPDVNDYYAHTKFEFLTEYFHLEHRR